MESCSLYLCTSPSPLLFVISHVVPLLGSKPGCEISKPCFFTSFMYLKKDNKVIGASNPTIFNLLLKKCTTKGLLFSIKMFNSKVLIPYKYVIVWCNNTWMQKSFGKPPASNWKLRHKDIVQIETK